MTIKSQVDDAAACVPEPGLAPEQLHNVLTRGQDFFQISKYHGKYLLDNQLFTKQIPPN